MCIEYLIVSAKIFSGFAVPVIGFLGAYIAWRQWRTAAYRYKMDLFDKRFDVYEAIIDFILSIRGGGKVSDESLTTFKDRTLPARFLFDEEIANYIVQIRESAIDVQTWSHEIEGMNAGEEKVEIQRKSSEVKKWLYSQLDEELNRRFQKYLGLGR